MSSASFAVTLAARRHGSKRNIIIFTAITIVFIYTTIANIFERPEGIKIAATFIAIIIATSLISRVWRSTELRVETIEMDEMAQMFIAEESERIIRIISHRRNRGDEEEYTVKELKTREDNHIPADDSIIFLEIQISDPSEFTGKI